MPFTISHAALVLPWRRLAVGRLVMSGLVLGSMAPDAEYLLRLRARHTISHSLPGLFAFCLPVGLAAVWIWDELIVAELAFLVDSKVDAVTCGTETRPRRAQVWSPEHVLAVSVSVLLGATSHLVWDAFTHEWGWPVLRWAVFRRPVLSVRKRPVPLYSIAQHVSSLAGLALVVFSIRSTIARALVSSANRNQQANLRRSTWLLFAVAGLTVAAVNGVCHATWAPRPVALRRVVSSAVVGGLSGVVVTATCFALLKRNRLWVNACPR